MKKINQKQFNRIIIECIIETLPPIPLTIITGSGKKYKMDVGTLMQELKQNKDE